MLAAMRDAIHSSIASDGHATAPGPSAIGAGKSPCSNRDNDEIRAMGYVALYSGYLEESIGDCFVRLKCFDTRRTDKMWQVSARIESCARAIGTLPRTEDLEAVLADLEHAALWPDSRAECAPRRETGG
jgi:hypothetical protein